MRFSTLLLFSVVAGQDTFFTALQSAEPGVRYQVVTTDDGVTLLEIEEEITDVEIDRRQAEGRGANKKLGQLIQKPHDDTSSKELSLRRTPARIRLEQESIRRGQRKRGNLSDSELRSLWLEFNLRGSVKRGSGYVSDVESSSVLGSGGGNLFENIVRKTEPGSVHKGREGVEACAGKEGLVEYKSSYKYILLLTHNY